MAINMVRQPSANYIVRSGANYYSESDINLTNSLGHTSKDYYASLENLVYGKINIDNTTYLVSTRDMEMIENTKNYNTISNIDDIVGLRYAYGNQDGYVIGRGNELSSSINGSTLKINSGRIVLQGVESDIDANGVSITVDNVSEKRYYTVYYRVNMGNDTTSIEKTYDTSTYPKVSVGDDLNKITSGIANLEIYHFTAQNGIISNVEKIVKPIGYVNGELIKSTKVDNAVRAEEIQFEGKGSVNRDRYSEFSSLTGGKLRQKTFKLENILQLYIKLKTDFSASMYSYQLKNSSVSSLGVSSHTISSDRYYCFTPTSFKESEQNPWSFAFRNFDITFASADPSAKNITLNIVGNDDGETVTISGSNIYYSGSSLSLRIDAFVGSNNNFSNADIEEAILIYKVPQE